MIDFRDVSFHYGGSYGTGDGVDHLNLHIGRGEVVVLCGRSGCGKTTITRLVNGLAPHFYEGLLEGSVTVAGIDVAQSDLSEISKHVGSVFQNPKSQFFNVDTTGELAFGCENQGLSREHIQKRLATTIRDLQLENLTERNIFELSGGEKQQIACGSAYATQPDIFVLDEPSSNLDKKAIWRLHDALLRMKEAGKTIVISEHRLYFLTDIADRFITIDDGYITHDYSAENFSRLSDDELAAQGLRCTDLHRVRQAQERAMHVKDAHHATPAIEGIDLSCNKQSVQILDIERLSLPQGSIVALIGDNGSGKSTLAESLCGIGNTSGSVALQGTYMDAKQRAKASFTVMQDVNQQLFCDTVMHEVTLNAPIEDSDARAVLDSLGLLELADRHPASLSGGQRQRVAVASALCAGKGVLFYDEPTSGLDREGMIRFGELLRDLQDRVAISVVVTHDLELVLQCCTHVAHIERGRVQSVYQLDADGVERVRYYFLSPSDKSVSTRRDHVSSFGKIMQYAGRLKWTTLASTVMLTGGVVASIVPYLLVYVLIADAMAGRPITLRGGAGICLAVLACELLYAFMYMGGLALSHRAAYGILENIRCALQEKLERQPLGSICELGTGALKKAFSDDVESIELLLAHIIPEGFANVIPPVVVLLVLLAIDWRLAVASMIAIAFGMSAMTSMYSTGMDKMGSYFAAAKRLNNTIVEYVRGMEVVKVFNREGASSQKYASHVYGYRDFALSWYKVCWPWMALYSSILPTVTLYVLPLGTLFVVLGQLALADLVLVLCLNFAIAPLLIHCTSFVGAFPQVSFKIQSLEKLLDRASLEEGDDLFVGTSHEVAFSHVHFAYGDREVLKDVSFTAPEHALTALVGTSGSGKSTIARCIAHHYDIARGSITIGGQDIRTMSLSALSDQVTYVSQELFLFNDTIMENVRAARKDATDEEVYAACRAAQCDEFIRNLQDGYQTYAGSGGAKLSGGQRQRIAFARAILKHAPIIVLDEATAFVDPENEAKMNVAVANMIASKTVIVIAHRMSQLVDAQKIVVLDGGRIVDEGMNEQLLGRCEQYRTLWNRSAQAESWTVSAETSDQDAGCARRRMRGTAQ